MQKLMCEANVNKKDIFGLVVLLLVGYLVYGSYSYGQATTGNARYISFWHAPFCALDRYYFHQKCPIDYE